MAPDSKGSRATRGRPGPRPPSPHQLPNDPLQERQQKPAAAKDDPHPPAVGREARRLREERDLTQEEPADCAGIHPNNMGRIEPGESDVGVKALFNGRVGWGSHLPRYLSNKACSSAFRTEPGCAAISAWQQFDYVFSPGGNVGGELHRSDTGAIADVLLLPYWFWSAIISAAILALLGWSLRRAFPAMRMGTSAHG